MRLTLTITDDQETATFEILPSPFTKSRDIGKAEVTTQSGDIYTDFVYKKLNFKYKWGFLTEAEYRQLEGFYDRQFSLNKYPRITIPSLGIENMVVRMQLSEQNIVNNCGMVEDVTVSFRETTQQSYTPQPVPPVIGDLVYMQDFATLTESEMASVINSMVEEQVYTLKDSRDQQDYKISKLKSGQVLMAEDLRIQNYKCTPEDTDILEGTLQIPASTSGNYPSGSTAETLAVRVEDDTAYYSWALATAGCNPADGDAKISIMPKGWGLPTGADFEKLIQFYPTSKDIMAEPAPNFKRTGFWNTSGIANRNQIYCWSSSVTDGSNPDFLIEPNSGNLYVRGQTVIGNGFAIRGIVRKKEPEE